MTRQSWLLCVLPAEHGGNCRNYNESWESDAQPGSKSPASRQAQSLKIWLSTHRSLDWRTQFRVLKIEGQWDSCTLFALNLYEAFRGACLVELTSSRLQKEDCPFSSSSPSFWFTNYRQVLSTREVLVLLLRTSSHRPEYTHFSAHHFCTHSGSTSLKEHSRELGWAWWEIETPCLVFASATPDPLLLKLGLWQVVAAYTEIMMFYANLSCLVSSKCGEVIPWSHQQPTGQISDAMNGWKLSSLPPWLQGKGAVKRVIEIKNVPDGYTRCKQTLICRWKKRKFWNIKPT